jgi:hypothetical protein
MGLFDGISEARVGGQNVYFLAGLYKIEVVKCFAMKSRKKEDLFIVECSILESTNDKRPAGTKASWVVNLKHDAALGNIKGFVAAANGIDPHDEETVNNEIAEKEVEYVVSDDNPLNGSILNLNCTDIETKAGNPFTLHAWELVE